MRRQNRKPVPHSARTNGTKNGQAFNHAKRVLGLGSRTKRLRDCAPHGLCSGTIPLCPHSGKLDQVPCDQIAGATRRKHARQFKESPQCLGLHLLHATFNDIVERDWGAVLRALVWEKKVKPYPTYPEKIRLIFRSCVRPPVVSVFR